MRWYEYKMEVDDLYAPDDLKAKLLAMQPGAELVDTEQDLAAELFPAAQKAPVRKKKAPLYFPKRQLGTLAACLALCVVGGNILFGSSLFGAKSADTMLRSTNSAASTAAAYDVSETAAGIPELASYTAENGIAAYSEEGRAVESDTQAKIIYTANLTLETKSYDAARTELDAALTAADGYLEESVEYTTGNDCRSSRLTLRIPQQNYESFLAAAEQAGNLTSKSQQAEDVTAQYLDVETRLANLEAQRTRLQQLQQQAETLSDLLEIESSLSDVQYQIESWQTQLDWYSRQVEHCTVTVSLNEVESYSPTREDFASRIFSAFAEGWTAFVAGVQTAAVWLIYLWPVLLLAAAALVIFFLLRKKRRR